MVYLSGAYLYTWSNIAKMHGWNQYKVIVLKAACLHYQWLIEKVKNKQTNKQTNKTKQNKNKSSAILPVYNTFT